LKYTKREIMTANRFVKELVSIKTSIETMKEEKIHDEWIVKVNKKISEINSRIRSSK